jgi:hypothetical protein
MTSLDLLHIPTPWHNSVVQLEGTDVFLVTKAKLARAALAVGGMTGGLARTSEGRACYFFLQQDKRDSPLDPLLISEPPQDVEREKESEATVAGIAVPGAVEEKNTPAPSTVQCKSTLSQKADVVVTAVARRNTGSLRGTEPSFSARHDSWLGRLRWILSLFWLRGM